MATTVLIVEDHAVIRSLVRELMAPSPTLHVVGEAEDGAEAMRLAEALQPDIMLLDFVLPGSLAWRSCGASGGVPPEPGRYHLTA